MVYCHTQPHHRVRVHHFKGPREGDFTSIREYEGGFYFKGIAMDRDFNIITSISYPIPHQNVQMLVNLITTLIKREII